MGKESGGKGVGASKGSAGPGKGGGDRDRASIEEEILNEAQGDEGDADGVETADDAEADDAESESADDGGDDDGAEGEENDGDSSEDAGQGDEEEEGDESEEDVDADDEGDGDDDSLRGLFLQQTKQIQQLVKALGDKQGADKPNTGMSDEQWAKVEEQTGMKKEGVQFLSERIFRPALQQLAKNFADQIAEIKGAGMFDSLAKDPKFKDVHAYRRRMEKFLETFAPEVRGNKVILRMAYLAAKGMGAKKALQDEGNRREVRKKITVKSRPGAGGAGAGDGKGGGRKISLTPVQKQAARLGGMSDAEYIKNMGHKRRK